MTPPVPNNASRETPILDFWAETWIGAVVLILISCSFFSLFSLLCAGAWIGSALALGWTILRISRTGYVAFSVTRFHGIGWGIPVLLALCLVSLLAGPHCFLDTYSYRLPQMFFWLQEGHPWSVPNVDMRINQMPHVWPMLSAAFYLPLGERALALPNYISLMLLASIFRRWAHCAINENQGADTAALVFLSAPVFLMGGATNDNVVTCVAFLALAYHFAASFESCGENVWKRRKALVLSAISFALCCGIKPQYIVLVPVWGAWFLFAPSRPWRCLSPLLIVVLLPVVLFCSPIPTFAVNQFRWGSYNSPWVVDTADPQPRPPWRPEKPSASRSFGALALTMLEPPVNPFFTAVNRVLHHSGHDLLAWFHLEKWMARPIAIAEHASFGFWTFVPWIAGLLLCAIRNRKNASPRNWEFPFRLLPLALLPFLLAAIYLTRAGSLGRSFIGFLVLTIPCSFAGIQRIPRKVLASWSFVCLASGISILILDPARPLWPVKTVLAKVSNYPVLARTIAGYDGFSHRHESADKLLAAIPANETRIGMVIEGGEPIADIWLRRGAGTRVIAYPRASDGKRLESDGIRFLVVKDDGLKRQLGEEWTNAFADKTGFSCIAESTNTTYLSKGPETWRLFSNR